MKLEIEKSVAEFKALQTQTGLDYAQKLRQEVSFTCVRGCSYCCCYPFLITIIEGLLLYRYLAAHGRWTPSLRKALRANRDKTLGLSLEVWLLSNIPCPLLEEKKCIAYKARPLHCQVTYSTGDPEMCHPHELGTETRLTPSSEIVIAFNTTLQTRLKRLEMLALLVPLSESLLLGESLDTGTLKIDELATQFLKDFNV